MPVRVLLSDDEVMLRQSLRAYLERQDFTVVAETSDGREAVELARKHRPDVAVLEIGLPRLNGLHAARELLRASPSLGIILLTRVLDEEYVRDALRDGVRGFMVKSQSLDDVVRALRDVAQGAVYVAPAASRAVVRASQALRRGGRESLSLREREVLRLVAEGKTTKQIAGLLDIRPKTAAFYRARLMKKLNIHDIAHLVRYAIRHGFAVL
jgi:DNA-binding NarL/FixJ family response regulator